MLRVEQNVFNKFPSVHARKPYDCSTTGMTQQLNLGDKQTINQKQNVVAEQGKQKNSILVARKTTTVHGVIMGYSSTITTI